MSSLEFFWALLAVSFSIDILLHIFPERQAMKMLLVYHVYSPKENYDFSKTLKKL
ncbi:hypothetical protein ACS127_14875 [Amphibacillus sp. Q70]|uniref:hypothetical protein n=1 Tax=Amphibacillus sp. Q70 TaxID=3453416 RepID=UPI003F864124